MIKNIAAICVLCIHPFLGATEVVIDQTSLKNTQDLKKIYQFHALDQAKSYSGENLTEYSLFSEKAGQTWKMEIYDLSRTVDPGYHKLQNEWVMALEGELRVRIDDKEAVFLPGQFGIIPAGSIHSLYPGKEGSRFLLLHMPGYDYPKDRFYDIAQPEAATKIAANANDSSFFIDRTIQLPLEILETLNRCAPLNPKSYHAKSEEGIYSIIPAEKTNYRWSVDIIELKNSKQIDVQTTSRFIVLNGEVEIEGENSRLAAGQSVRFSAGTQLALRPIGSLARVLRVSHF